MDSRDHQASRTIGRRLRLLALALAIVGGVGLVVPNAGAREVLADPNFDNCSSDDWDVQPQSVTVDCSGNGAVLTSDQTMTLSTDGAAEPGAAYVAEITVSVVGTADVELLLDIWGQTQNLVIRNVDDDEATLTVSATALPSATFFTYEVTFVPTGSVTVTVSGASLMETAAPTPTPTDTATATNSPTIAPTSVDAATTTGTPMPTALATSTRRATPAATAPWSGTKTPTATTSSGTGDPKLTSTPTPRSSPPDQGGTGSTAGAGLLINGSFDLTTETGLVGWTKFGGTLAASVASGRSGVAYFDSTTDSTKWIYQTVRVTAGDWYEGAVWARFVAGKGEAFIRISWYASTDGSGSALSTDEGTGTSSDGWTNLSIGSVQAPPGAYSVRFRLMLRPIGNATVMFDAASLVVSQPTTPTPEPTPATAESDPTEAVGPVATISKEPTAETTTAPTAVAADALTTPVQETQPTTLRFSELLPNPVESGNDAAYEWVELVNFGSDPVDTTGWRIDDDLGSDAIPAAVVPPGAYLVVAGSLAVIPDDVPYVRIDDGRIGNGLNNLGEQLTLRAPDGSLVDETSYGDTADTPAPGAGETIGIAGTTTGDDLGDIWMLTLEATPGFPNIFPGADTILPTATATESTEPEVVAEEGSTGEPLVTSDEGERPPVTEPGKRSTIPLFILVAAAGAGIGGFAVRRGPAFVHLKERITRRA